MIKYKYSLIYFLEKETYMDVLFFSTIAEQIKKEINYECGLNISQTRILLFFDETNNEPLAMGKLTDALNISLSTLSRQLQQKKTQSLIKVIRSEKDSSKIINLNSDGLQKAQILKQSLKQIENLLFMCLDQDAKSVFIRQLTEIAHNSASLGR